MESDSICITPAFDNVVVAGPEAVETFRRALAGGIVPDPACQEHPHGYEAHPVEAEFILEGSGGSDAAATHAGSSIEGSYIIEDGGVGGEVNLRCDSRNADVDMIEVGGGSGVQVDTEDRSVNDGSGDIHVDEGGGGGTSPCTGDGSLDGSYGWRHGDFLGGGDDDLASEISHDSVTGGSVGSKGDTSDMISDISRSDGNFIGIDMGHDHNQDLAAIGSDFFATVPPAMRDARMRPALVTIIMNAEGYDMNEADFEDDPPNTPVTPADSYDDDEVDAK